MPAGNGFRMAIAHEEKPAGLSGRTWASNSDYSAPHMVFSYGFLYVQAAPICD